MPVICFSRNVLRAVLSKCLAFVLRLSCVPVEMSCVRSRLLFAACAPNRTACGMFRSYSAVGRDRHSCVLGCRVVIGLCWFTSGLRVFWRRSRRGNEGTRGTEAARQSAFLRDHIGFAAFSAGSPLGAACPQTCAKESSTLWTLFIWVVMWVRFTRRRTLGYNEDLTESNLCSGKSCGRTIAPIRLVI